MLFEMATADAYAIAFEFVENPKTPNDLAGFYQHPTHVALKPGSYTDDTQRAIANAKIVLSGEQNWFRPDRYIEALQIEFRKDPREGWSRNFQTFLQNNLETDPVQFMRRLNRRSTNGCLMGVAPLGYLPCMRDVRLATTMQVIATHSAAAVPFAQCISLAAYYLLRDLGPLRMLTTYLCDEVEWGSDEDRDYFISRATLHPPKAAMPARTIATAAIWNILNYRSQAEILSDTVGHGGDTDSLAAVSIALASCTPEIRADLPSVLTQNLEHEPHRVRLHYLDHQLKSLLTPKSKQA